MPPISQISIDNNGVLKLLKRLDVHKAMGPEGIPNIVLKNCADEILQGLRTVFQCSLNTGTQPSDWRNANITPVFKKGDRNSAENYRSVCLTSVPCIWCNLRVKTRNIASRINNIASRIIRF